MCIRDSLHPPRQPRDACGGPPGNRFPARSASFCTLPGRQTAPPQHGRPPSAPTAASSSSRPLGRPAADLEVWGGTPVEDGETPSPLSSQSRPDGVPPSVCTILPVVLYSSEIYQSTPNHRPVRLIFQTSILVTPHTQPLHLAPLVSVHRYRCNSSADSRHLTVAAATAALRFSANGEQFASRATSPLPLAFFKALTSAIATVESHPVASSPILQLKFLSFTLLPAPQFFS